MLSIIALNTLYCFMPYVYLMLSIIVLNIFIAFRNALNITYRFML